MSPTKTAKHEKISSIIVLFRKVLQIILLEGHAKGPLHHKHQRHDLLRYPKTSNYDQQKEQQPISNFTLWTNIGVIPTKETHERTSAYRFPHHQSKQFSQEDNHQFPLVILKILKYDGLD